MTQIVPFEDFRNKLALFVGNPDAALEVLKAKPDQLLANDLQFDSLAMLELQIGFEDAYNISLSCQEVNLCKTMADLHALVQKKLN